MTLPDGTKTEGECIDVTGETPENEPPPLPDPPSLLRDLGIFPNIDQWMTDYIDHGYARLMNRMYSDMTVEECVAAGLCQTLSQAIDMFGPIVGGQYNPAKAAMLGKRADDLIRGSLKASASYRAELGQRTYADIIELSQGYGAEAQAAKGMKKLIEQSDRLAKTRGR